MALPVASIKEASRAANAVLLTIFCISASTGTGLETSFTGKCVARLQHCNSSADCASSKDSVWLQHEVTGHLPHLTCCSCRFKLILHKKGAMPKFIPQPFETPILENNKEICWHGFTFNVRL